MTVDHKISSKRAQLCRDIKTLSSAHVTAGEKRDVTDTYRGILVKDFMGDTPFALVLRGRTTR